MIRKIENISKQIEDQIQIKELEVSNIIRDVPPIILILERGFVEMKSLVLSENFKTNSDEIHFFKETKPKLFSKLIYYKKIHNIELNKPVCGFDTIKEYLEKEQENINFFSCIFAMSVITYYYLNSITNLGEITDIRKPL